MLFHLLSVMWHKPYKGQSIKGSILIKDDMNPMRNHRDQQDTVVMYCRYLALFLRHTVHNIVYIISFITYIHDMEGYTIFYYCRYDYILPFLGPLA